MDRRNESGDDKIEKRHVTGEAGVHRNPSWTPGIAGVTTQRERYLFVERSFTVL